MVRAGRAAVWGLVLVLAGVAGCVGNEEASSAGGDGELDPSSGGSAAGPQAVVALIDTGINPYHEAFRDDSPLAHTHPSEYLPGYPETAEALNLTLDAQNLTEAREADEDVWSTVTEDELYWIPGTKIVAAMGTEGDPPIFSTGHGTMTASRAAANQYSLCPDCRIAAVQGLTADRVRWAAQQPWIDAQSNSWSPIVPMEEPYQETAEAFEAAADRHLVFASAGNGAGGKAGVLGHPSITRSTSGPPGVVAAGGHDNGQVALWPGSTPQVAADACSNMAVEGDAIEGYGPHGGGTSSASPYAAGAAAQLVLEAREMLGDDHERGVANATLARGNGTGYGELLADDDLTLEETKRLLFRTAEPRPSEGPHDGEVCGATSAPYNAYPVTWDEMPDDVPSYYFVGFGGVSPESLDRATSVLEGEEPLPEREEARSHHERVTSLRETYHEVPESSGD